MAPLHPRGEKIGGVGHFGGCATARLMALANAIPAGAALKWNAEAPRSAEDARELRVFPGRKWLSNSRYEMPSWKFVAACEDS